jgi:hypothetical protein
LGAVNAHFRGGVADLSGLTPGNVRKKIDELDAANLDKFIEDTRGQSGVDEVRTGRIYAEEKQRKNARVASAPRLATLLEGGFRNKKGFEALGVKDEEGFNEVVNKLLEGDRKTFDTVTEAINSGENADLLKNGAKALKEQRKEGLLKLQLETLKVEQAASAFQSGDLSFRQFLVVLDKELAAAERLYAGDQSAENLANLAEKRKQKSDALVAKSQRDLSNIDAQNKFSGVNDPVARMNRLISASKQQDLTPEAREDFLNQARAEVDNIRQKALANVESAAERYRILQQGFDTPLGHAASTPEELEAARRETIKEDARLADIRERQLLVGRGSAVDQADSEIRAALRRVSIAKETGNIVEQEQASLEILEAQRKKEQAELEAILDERLLAAERTFNPLTIAETKELNAREALADARRVGNPDEIRARERELLTAEEATRQENIRQRDANSDLTISGLRDPTQIIQEQIRRQREKISELRGRGADYTNALAELNKLEREAAEIRSAQADADSNLIISTLNDPALIIQEQIRRQRQRINELKGTGQDYTNALAELNNLEKQAAELKSQQVAAETDLLVAQAESRGDDVEAARLKLGEANRVLAEAIANKAGPTAIASARASATRAATSFADAQYNEALENIQFQLDMEEITAGQAIALYEQMLTLETNEDRRRDLMRKIKSLKDSLGQDLQFNLPTELGLPTLYQARLIRQTGQTTGTGSTNNSIGAAQAGLNGGQALGFGGGTIDNRIVNITLAINNGLDQAKMIDILNDALGKRVYAPGTVRRYLS